MATVTKPINSTWSEVSTVGILFQIISSGQVYFKYSDAIPTNGDFSSSHSFSGNGIINLPEISGQTLYASSLQSEKIVITEL